jgi:hypothetical protein
MEGTRVKLLYAIALSFFPLLAASVAAPAQSPDMTLLSALCSDDYYEDTAGHCSAISAGEVFTLEAILEKYGAIVTRDADVEIVVFCLTDPEDIPVGSIHPLGESPTAENAIVTEDESSAETAIGQNSIASHVVTAESPLEKGDGADDEVTTTGPTARRIPATEGPVDDNGTIE